MFFDVTRINDKGVIMNRPMIRYLSLSDIHLGHIKNKTIKIIEHLDRYFVDNLDVMSKLDILFLVGDIYDRLLSNAGDDDELVTAWLSRVAMFCKRYDIKLRVLEGTPSHDWRQAKIFNTTLAGLKTDIDFKYIDSLSIEHISDLGIDVLYVPDEWNHNAADTFAEVKELLKEKKLTKVDITMLHGQFHYQLPMITLDSSHNEEDYLSITRYFISAGHIHTHSVFKRIVAQGSFDRLSHNEEEKKGAVFFTIYKNRESTYKFIENKLATIFKSIKVSEKDLKNLTDRLRNVLKNIPPDSHIRLIMDSNNSLRKSFHDIKDSFKQYHFIMKTIDPTVVEENAISKNLLKSTKHTGIQITKRNIEELILDEVSDMNLIGSDISMLKEELSLVS